MMDEKDLKEYEDNIRLVQGIKLSNKYNYIQGKQITDHGTGTRVYDINNSRLPSVTTILGATKDQQFLKDWKAKVGEQRAEEIKNHSSRRGTAMHKFLESHIQGVGYDDLTGICTPDLYYQEFKMQDADLKAWKHKFLKRLDMYHELQFDEKEKTKPMKAEDFINE
jgi:hypothetical protein